MNPATYRIYREVRSAHFEIAHTLTDEEREDEDARYRNIVRFIPVAKKRALDREGEPTGEQKLRKLCKMYLDKYSTGDYNV